MQTSYTAIKKAGNRLRLWVEGCKPVAAGFLKGMYYKRVVQGEVITFTIEDAEACAAMTAKDRREKGIFIVSGREKNNVIIPIFDCNLKDYEDTFPEGTRIRAVFMKGVIKATIHHEEMAKRRRESSFIKALKDGSITEASFCTGGGISTTAVHDGVAQAGLNGNVAWVVDSDLRYLQSAYQHSYAITDDTACFECTLEELEVDLLSEVNLLSFSLPCSGLSKAGTTKHKLTPEEHESGTSLFGAKSIIKASNAAVLLSENVVEAQGSPMYVLLIQELKRMGYKIVEAVLNSKNTGSFENRNRYWLMAYSDGLPAECFEQVFNFFFEKRYGSFGELMDETVDNSAWCANDYLKEKSVRDLEAGKGYGKRQLLTEATASCGVIGKYYSKKRSAEPFVINDDGMERLFSLPEHCRAKTIPEALVKHCNQTVGHEILGQSIDYIQAMEPIRRAFVALRSYFAVPTPMLTLVA